MAEPIETADIVKHLPSGEKRIHAAGMFGASGKRRTWCGVFVNDDQLPIIGTDREINCKRCKNGRVWREHQKRWAGTHLPPKTLKPKGQK